MLSATELEEVAAAVLERVPEVVTRMTVAVDFGQVKEISSVSGTSQYAVLPDEQAATDTTARVHARSLITGVSVNDRVAILRLPSGANWIGWEIT